MLSISVSYHDQTSKYQIAQAFQMVTSLNLFLYVELEGYVINDDDYI